LAYAQGHPDSLWLEHAGGCFGGMQGTAACTYRKGT
jgi:hypothetical protein